jgi:hypothetical protein
VSVPPSGPYIPQVYNASDPDVKTSAMQSAISALSSVYQVILVSGTNIKTVNGSSLLGSGDLTVSGSLGTFTKAQLDTAITDGNAVFVGDALNGSLGATTPSTVAATTISASGTATIGAQITLNGVTSGVDFCNATLGQWNLRSDNSGYLKIGRFSGGNTYFADNLLNVNSITGVTSLVLPLTNLAGRPLTIGQQAFYSDNSTGDFILYDNINSRNYLRINRDTAIWNITTSMIVAGNVRLGTYTVATLPSASANTRARAFVSDSNLAFNSTNLGSTVTAGGSTLVPVFSNGTNWVIG